MAYLYASELQFARLMRGAMLSFLFCLCPLMALHARELKFKTFNVDNGLSQNTVWDFLIDYRGFLWIGTADGINRFDGERIVRYDPAPDRRSFIQTDVVFHFIEDSGHELWASSTKGFGHYNRIRDTFETVYLTKKWCTLLGDDGRGHIWFADGSDSLFSWDKRERRIVGKVKLPANQEGKTSSTMNVVSLPRHFVAVLDLNHILVLNKQTGNYTICRSEKYQSSYLGYINDSTLISCQTGVLFRYRLCGDSLIANTYSVPANNHIIGFTGYLQSAGRLFAGSPMGLFELDTSTYAIKDSLFNAYDLKQREFTYMQMLRSDRAGRWYLCTNGAGLKILDPYNNKFQHYRMDEELNNMVKSICVTPDGILLTGLWGRGVIAYNHTGHGALLQFRQARTLNSVLAIANWSADVVLLVQSKELVWYHYRSKKVLRRQAIGDSNSFFFPQIRNRRLVNFVFNGGSRIVRIEDNGKLSPVLELAGTQIRTYLGFSSGFLLGTSSGLLRYYGPGLSMDTIIRNNIIKDLCRTSDSSIWVATTEGLYHLSPTLKVTSVWNTGNGLPNNCVYGILEDKYRRIWFSHNKGISCLDPNSGAFQHFSVSDGLQSNEFNTGAFFKDAAGFLYFGGVNGVNKIDPAHILRDTGRTKLAINQIFVNDELLHTDTAYNELSILSLPYDQNTLSFNFAALELCRPEACRYRYQLVGFDKHPIESGSVHFARYANLPPDEYVFRVWVSNPDGMWSNTARELYLHIDAPFWQTLPFRILWILIGGALVCFPVYMYLRSQRRKSRRLAEIRGRLDTERMRISRDLHDNVGAQLSFLINNIDWMQEHPDLLKEQEISDRLRTLGDAGRNAMHTLRQTIWAFSNTAVSVDDFADRFKQFALRMLELNPDVRMNIEEQLDPATTLSPALALNMFRMGQEAFNNSLKHSGCKLISVHFVSDEQFLLSLTISDDGHGFDKNQVEETDSYGLQNLKLRAQEIDATVKIISEPDAGTTVLMFIERSTKVDVTSERL